MWLVVFHIRQVVNTSYLYTADLIHVCLSTQSRRRVGEGLIIQLKVLLFLSLVLFNTY